MHVRMVGKSTPRSASVPDDDFRPRLSRRRPVIPAPGKRWSRIDVDHRKPHREVWTDVARRRWLPVPRLGSHALDRCVFFCRACSNLTQVSDNGIRIL